MREEKYTNRIEGYCRCGCSTKIIKYENSNLSVFKHGHRFTTENDVNKSTNIFRCSSCKDLIENSFISLQEAEKLVANPDSQKELLNLQNENKQLKERVNELENTIENMKAIAGEKIESIGSITSVDYTSDNTTELIEVFSNESGYVMQCNSCKEKHSTDFQSKFNFCPNCGRKIVRN